MQDRGTWASGDVYCDGAFGFIGFKIPTELNYDTIFHKLEGAILNEQQISMP
jgi:hypothetical protein